MNLQYTDQWKKFVQRIKKQFNPPHPTSLLDMHEKLSTEKGKVLLQFEGGKSEHMTAHIVENLNKDGTTSHSLVLVDVDFIHQVIHLVKPRSLEGFCDATFKPVPRDVQGTQLLVFQVNRFNNATVLFYAIMERKCTEAYEAIFELIMNQLVPELKDALGKVHIDFELAESNAMKNIIPHIKIVTCLFHFAQAQWRNAKNNQALIKKTHHGKKRNLTEEQQRTSNEIEELLRRISKLPFLKAVDIDEELLNRLLGCMSSQAQEKVQKYIEYFKRQWLKRWVPDIWSLHGEAHRTNNFSESNNRDINLIIRQKPLPWDFIRSIVKIQKTIRRQFQNRLKAKKYNRKLEAQIHKWVFDYSIGQIQAIDLVLQLVKLSRGKDDKDIERFQEEAEEEDMQVVCEREDVEGNAEDRAEESGSSEVRDLELVNVSRARDDNEFEPLHQEAEEGEDARVGCERMDEGENVAGDAEYRSGECGNDDDGMIMLDELEDEFEVEEVNCEDVTVNDAMQSAEEGKKQVFNSMSLHTLVERTNSIVRTSEAAPSKCYQYFRHFTEDNASDDEEHYAY